MSIRRGIDKEDVGYVCVSVCVYVYAMEYYSAIKKNEVMSFAATWMDLEIVILNGVRQKKQNII